MKAIKGVALVMVSLMMLAVSLACGKLYFTMDARQAQFETKVTGSLNALSGSLTTAVNAKMDALTTEIHGQLEPVSSQTTALLTALTGKVNALDVDGLNKGVADMLTAATNAAGGVTTAVSNANATVSQVNEALPYIIDCDPAHAGADCLPNRYLEIAHETESALKAISAATPSIAASVKQSATAIAVELPKITANIDGITTDAHTMTTDATGLVKTYTTPPTLKQKWIAFGKTILYVVVRAVL